MKQSSEEKTDFCSVFTQLKSLGVKVPKNKKFKSSIPKQAKPTPSVFFSRNKIFGISISEQEKISIEDFALPKFIVTTTDYLRKFTQQEVGLFRKAGSISRQRDLRVKLENGESIDDCEPNDIASLLKQWLRELPEPLIPVYLQDLFVRCQNLRVEENKVSAVLLCCHLLPADHFYTFKHLLNFLSDIAKYSHKNKMGAHNLAVIMAPNIFVMGSDAIDKFSNALVQQHTSVIELLINNAHRVGLNPPCPSHLVEAEILKDAVDLDLSLDALEYSPSKSKKKRRSGTVQDIFIGIRKLVGQNSLSPNPSKRSNQENSNSDTRSASKRKADPEHLPSMSPLKKKATASSVLQNETSFFTPNNKIAQSIFGGKEKSGSAHSRRKSFGLLRRKEKKRKNSSKSNLVETKLTVSTPDPFQEKLVASLQKSAKTNESIFDKSPLLSPIDIENLFSKSGIMKKSVSDCYLTIQNSQNKQFSTSSSEGCLHFQGNSPSPYNLRSTGGKKAIKRKSDEHDCNSGKFGSAASAEKENAGPSFLPVFYYENLKNSPMAKRRSRSPKSPKNLNSSSSISTSPDQNKNSYILKVTDQTNSLKVPDILIQESYHNKKITNNVETINSSVNPAEKSVSDMIQVRSDIKDASDGVPSLQSEVVSSTVPNLQIDEKVIRKSSIKRQEAFIIKSKSSRKNTLNQLKRADSIKISKSRNSRTNHQNDASTAEGKTSQKSDLNSTKVANSNVKKNDNTIPTNTSDKKHVKRSVRKGSIVRGRPNTVKTGLPSDLCSRYNNESFINIKNRVASSSSVDNDLFIKVVNESEKNYPDLSVILQNQNISVSPKGKISTKRAESKNKVLNCTLEASISVNKSEIKIITDSRKENPVLDSSKKSVIIDKTDVNAVLYPEEPKNTKTKSFKTASKRKNRGRLCSNSDSKIHAKKRSSKVSRINSFPESAMKLRPRKAQKLRAVKSSSPKRSLEKTATAVDGIGKENLGVPNQSNLCVKTPETNFQTPESWVSGKTFLESEKASEEDIFNKRESIAMITRNLAGHVKAKASLYDCRNTTSTSTPMMLRSANTPSERFYNANNMQSSQKRNTSLKSNRSTRRNSPLPPPPKFVIPDSPPVSSYPLKELTNLSNTEDTFFTPSPGRRSFNTPNNDGSSSKKRSTKCTLKPKMKSYSGHTPFKLPVDRSKVFRSESSPLLPKVANKPSRKSQGSTSSQNSLITKYFSPILDENCFVTPVSKTRSSLSIEKLRSDQLLDEWNCEM